MSALALTPAQSADVADFYESMLGIYAAQGIGHDRADRERLAGEASERYAEKLYGPLAPRILWHVANGQVPSPALAA